MSSDAYPCKIIDWLDGDTAVVDATAFIFGTPITLMQHVRIYGINSPEVHSKDATEKAAGLAAKTFAFSLAPAGARVTIAVSPNGWHDKYGRLLANVALANGKDFATEMIAANHAVPWDGQGPKPI